MTENVSPFPKFLLLLLWTDFFLLWCSMFGIHHICASRSPDTWSFSSILFSLRLLEHIGFQCHEHSFLLSRSWPVPDLSPPLLSHLLTPALLPMPWAVLRGSALSSGDTARWSFSVWLLSSCYFAFTISSWSSVSILSSSAGPTHRGWTIFHWRWRRGCDEIDIIFIWGNRYWLFVFPGSTAWPLRAWHCDSHLTLAFIVCLM